MKNNLKLIQRFKENPIIKPDMPGLEGKKGQNINGPSLIKVPEWVNNPLGRYYLYFAHHGGEYIRLAYSDELGGSWKIFKTGVLHVNQTDCSSHLASPDVHIDEKEQRIRMYFHGSYKKDKQTGKDYLKNISTSQRSFVAFSENGLSFKSESTILGPPYFRVFKHDNYYYAVAKYGSECGVIIRSRDGITTFKKGKYMIENMRHTALYKKNNDLFLFYSKIGDKPERIKMIYIDLNDKWTQWELSTPFEILNPQREYEGIESPEKKSDGGSSDKYLRELRDPNIFKENDQLYLLYSVAGEKGIAISKLSEEKLYGLIN